MATKRSPGRAPAQRNDCMGCHVVCNAAHPQKHAIRNDCRQNSKHHGVCCRSSRNGGLNMPTSCTRRTIWCCLVKMLVRGTRVGNQVPVYATIVQKIKCKRLCAHCHSSYSRQALATTCTRTCTCQRKC